MAAYDRIPGSAMVVVAHPDDAEFMCAGTVARWAEGGARVTYVVVTRGDKGSDEPTMTSDALAAIREAEQRAAGSLLGVEDFVFMGYMDAYLQHTMRLRRDITRLVRRHQPEVVITFDPTTRFFGDSYANHPDHRVTGDATVDAVFPSARDRLTFPELLAEGLQPHKVRELWLGFTDHPNVTVDISHVFDRKRDALLAHPSQIGPDAVAFAAEFAGAAAVGEPFEYGEVYRRVVLEAAPD